MKLCKKCGNTKPLTEFYKHPKTSDRRGTYCKECSKKSTQENRKKRRAYYRSYDKNRVKTSAQRRDTRRATQKFRHNHPEKYAAHNILWASIKRGDVIRPSKCSQCGIEGPVDGHHDDYSQPLVVRWLCPLCHAETR